MSADPKPGKVPAEVLTYLMQRKVRGAWSHEDVWNKEHTAAFAVAKATEESVVESIKRAVTDAIEQGTPFEEFAANIQPILEKQGWWGRQSRVNPLTGEEEDVQLGSAARLKLIYQTNIRQSRAAGQWSRIQRSKAFLPKLRYRHGHPERPRPDHLAWDGITLPVDDPWWDIHYPQNGHGCQCWVEQVGSRAPTTPEEGVDRELVEVENKRTGQRTMTAKGVDPSFAYNVGKTRMAGLTPPRPILAKPAPKLPTVDERMRELGNLDLADARKHLSGIIATEVPGAVRSGNYELRVSPEHDVHLEASGAAGLRYATDGSVEVHTRDARRAGTPPAEGWTAEDEKTFRPKSDAAYDARSLAYKTGDAKDAAAATALEQAIASDAARRDANFKWRSSVSVLVHEELHSHGPLGLDPDGRRNPYRAEHAVIEEVATEILARRIAAPMFEHLTGAYQSSINEVLAILGQHSKRDPHELLIEASRAYKATAPSDNITLTGAFTDAIRSVDKTVDGLSLLNALENMRLPPR